MTNKFEFKNRKIAATAIEESLPFAAGFLVEQMRAAVFAKTARTLAPAHRCRLYGHCCRADNYARRVLSGLRCVGVGAGK